MKKPSRGAVALMIAGVAGVAICVAGALFFGKKYGREAIPYEKPEDWKESEGLYGVDFNVPESMTKGASPSIGLVTYEDKKGDVRLIRVRIMDRGEAQKETKTLGDIWPEDVTVEGGEEMRYDGLWEMTGSFEFQDKKGQYQYMIQVGVRATSKDLCEEVLWGVLDSTQFDDFAFPRVDTNIGIDEGEVIHGTDAADPEAEADFYEEDMQELVPEETEDVSAEPQPGPVPDDLETE